MESVDKIKYWLLLCALCGIEAGLLYSGFNGAIQSMVIPMISYLFGLVTKTAVDKVVKKE
jgi:hypothetical protein